MLRTEKLKKALSLVLILSLTAGLFGIVGTVSVSAAAFDNNGKYVIVGEPGTFTADYLEDYGANEHPVQAGKGWVVGKSGKALNLNGHQYVRFDNNLARNLTAMTIDGWVYWRGDNSPESPNPWDGLWDQPIIGMGGDGGNLIKITPWQYRNNPQDDFVQDLDGTSAEIFYNNARSPVLYQPIDPGFVDYNPLDQNQWVHIALTIQSNGTATYYINGTVYSSAAFNHDLRDYAFDWCNIGSYWYGPRFNGMIDEFSIYNYALTQNEIQADMNQISYFDDNGEYKVVGEKNDSAGAFLFGAPIPDTAWVSGKSGQGVSLDGFGERVEFAPQAISGLNEFTVEGWTYWKGDASPESPEPWFGYWGQPLLGFGGPNDRLLRLIPAHFDNNALKQGNMIMDGIAAELYYGDYGNPQMVYKPAAEGSGGNAMPIFQWSHFALTVKGNDKIAIYMNGDLVAEQPLTHTMTDYIFEWCNIGAWFYGDTFNGILDEIVIHNTALTANAISDIYNKPTTPEELPSGVELTSSSLSVNSNTLAITGVEPGTTVETLMSNISAQEGTVTAYDKNGQSVTSGTVTTGTVIELSYQGLIAGKYTVIIYGDIDQNGAVDLLDMVTLKKALLKTLSLGNAAFDAADLNDDKILNPIDLVEMKKAMLGIAEVSQADKSDKAISLDGTRMDTFYNLLRSDYLLGDPYATYAGGAYYYTQSNGDGLEIFKSDTLSGMQSAENKFVWTAADHGLYDVWAPEIHFVDGIWYAYFAATTAQGANNTHRMYVMTSQSADPFGAWNTAVMLALPENKWAIDGSLFINADGKMYFIWSGWANTWDGVNDQPQNLYICEMSSPDTVKAGTTRVLINDHSVGSEWKQNIVEGPSVFINGDKVFLTYSASYSGWNNYNVAYAELTGDPMLSQSWVEKGFIMRTNSGTDVVSPGHASVVPSPDGSELYLVYHAQKYTGSGWDRSARFQKLVFDASGYPVELTPAQVSSKLAVPSGENAARVNYTISEAAGSSVSENSGSMMFTSADSKITFNINVPKIGKYAIYVNYSYDASLYTGGEYPYKRLGIRVNDCAQVSPVLAPQNPGQWGVTGARIALTGGSNEIVLYPNAGLGDTGIKIESITIEYL